MTHWCQWPGYTQQVHSQQQWMHLCQHRHHYSRLVKKFTLMTRYRHTHHASADEVIQDFNKESLSNSSRTMSTDLLRRKKPFVSASANTAKTRPCWSTTTQLQTSAGVVYIHTMSAHGVNRHFVLADTVNNTHIQQHEQARHQRYRMDSKQLRANTMRSRIPQPLRSNLQGPNWNLAKVGSANMTRSTYTTWWYVTTGYNTLLEIRSTHNARK